MDIADLLEAPEPAAVTDPAAGAMADLIGEVMELDDVGVEAELGRIELAERALAARRAAVVAVGEARRVFRRDGHHGVRNWVRARCNTSHRVTTRQLRLARLVDAAPVVGDALLAGRIGVAQADELAAVFANPRVRDFFGSVVPLLLDHAEHLPFDDFRVCVQRWVMLADLDGSWRDVVRDRDRRTASVSVNGSAVEVSAAGGDALAAEAMIQIFNRFVEAEFRKDVEARRAEHGESAEGRPLPRTAAQRRFDALAAIFDAAVAAPADGVAPEPVVDIRCDATTFDETFTRAGILLPNGNQADLDDLDPAVAAEVIETAAADPVGWIDRRCETESGIPIHPILMLQAALTGHVRRQVVDSRDVVVRQGQLVRLFTGNARIAAKAAATVCSHLGCDVPARYAEVDHMDEWVAHQGPTEPWNADVRCGPHNRFKHRNGWRSRRATTGRVYNIRPDGTVVVPIGERPPDLTHDELDRLTRQRLATLTNTHRRPPPPT